MRDHIGVVSAESDKMPVANASLVGKRDSAHHKVVGLQARVTKLESQAQAPHVPAAEITDAFCERDI